METSELRNKLSALLMHTSEEHLDREYQERMDRREEITSFANRW